MARSVRRCLPVVAFVWVLAVASPALASPAGTLDPTFGSGGITYLIDPGGALWVAGAVGLPDGSVVVGTNRGRTSPTAITLTKVSADGAVVSGFETDGFAAASWVRYPFLRALVLDPEGRIVAVGEAATADGGQAWLVARFGPDGALDPSFGRDGVVVMPQPGYAAAYAVGIMPDDGLLVGGASRGPDSYTQRWALAKFDDAGDLDPSFGAGGMTVLPFADYFGVQSLAVRPDGRFLAEGYSGPDQDSHGMVARFLPDGAVDTTFGDTGVAVPAAIEPASIILDEQGRVVISGYVTANGVGFGLARLQPNGTPDDSFGTSGATSAFEAGSEGSAQTVAVQPDGDLVAAGAISTDGESNFAVVRFNGDGSVDGGFGNGGRADVPLDYAHISAAADVSFQPDGRIVVVGRAEDQDGRPEATVRRFFASDGPPAVVDWGPDGPVATRDVTFRFSSPDPQASFSCSLDGSDYEPCSSPVPFAGLADGAHSFSVRATDLAHNIGPAATRAFTVDTVAPAATIDSGPSGTVYVQRVSFSFSSDEPGASSACALDAGPFLPCASPTVLEPADGSHTFQVRATDPAGNTGPAVARVFTVDTADAYQPDASIATGAGVVAGVGIVNDTGRRQQATARLQPGRSSTFRIWVENAGAVPDRFRVRGRDAVPGCELTYFHRGEDVTPAVTGNLFVTRTMNPGKRTLLTLRVTVRPKAPLGLRPSIDVTTSSVTNRRAGDVVVAKVVVR